MESGINLSMIWLTLIFVFSVIPAFAAQQPIEEKVVVTANAYPVPFENLSRAVAVFTREDIDNLPARSIADILAQAASVDIRSRAPFGMQTDLSVRGSSFSQVLVLVDGMRINDSQTGHHNADIPVPLQDIERVEVLLGPGSSVYGADAFGGTVNIITRHHPGAGAIFHRSRTGWVRRRILFRRTRTREESNSRSASPPIVLPDSNMTGILEVFRQARAQTSGNGPVFRFLMRIRNLEQTVFMGRRLQRNGPIRRSSPLSADSKEAPAPAPCFRPITARMETGFSTISTCPGFLKAAIARMSLLYRQEFDTR